MAGHDASPARVFATFETTRRAALDGMAGELATNRFALLTVIPSDHGLVAPSASFPAVPSVFM